MADLTVITVVRGRPAHLDLQGRGLDRSEDADFDWVVVSMGDPAVTHWRPPGRLTPTVVHHPVDGAGLPLAAARNRGAGRALAFGSRTLVFLDVDCVPDPGLVASYRAASGDPTTASSLMCGPVSYLPPAPPGGYDLDTLASLAPPHPARPAPARGSVVLDGDPDLFWSLSFAVRAETWRLLGGFCERYVGYGAEDTDLGWTARSKGVGLSWIGGAGAHHQHHPTLDPPTQHLDDILRNGSIFHDRWGVWPMRGWLDAFVEQGLVRRTPLGYERTVASQVEPPPRALNAGCPAATFEEQCPALERGTGPVASRGEDLMSHMGKEPDVELEGVPAEEGISKADAQERVEVDPEDQVNRTEHTDRDQLPEDDQAE